jgi:hypothetical protein
MADEESFPIYPVESTALSANGPPPKQAKENPQIYLANIETKGENPPPPEVVVVSSQSRPTSSPAPPPKK